MIRSVLTIILTGLIALPHGICFCDFLRFADEKSHCAAAPDSAPMETPDDHEHDCPCKLREVMASLHTGFDDVGAGLIAVCLDVNQADVGLTDRWNAVLGADIHSLNAPSALPFCALRI